MRKFYPHWVFSLLKWFHRRVLGQELIMVTICQHQKGKILFALAEDNTSRTYASIELTPQTARKVLEHLNHNIRLADQYNQEIKKK